MNSRLVFPLGMLLLVTDGVVAQDDTPQEHPEAKVALEQVVVEADFGDYKFDHHDISTMKNNPQVPGLGGLMFVRYKSGKTDEVELSVTWHEDKQALDSFFARTKQNPMFKKHKVGEQVILQFKQDDGQACSWTDGKHLVISMLSGEPIPEELINAYLAVIPSALTQ